MIRLSRTILLLVLTFSFLSGRSFAEDPALNKIMERLERLEKKQEALEEQLKAKDARIKELETELKQVKQETKQPATITKPETQKPEAEIGATKPAEVPGAEAEKPAPVPETEKGTEAEKYVEIGSMMVPYSVLESRAKWVYEPGKGFRIFTSRWGEMNISIYSYARYLNQKGTSDSFTDAFDRTFDIDPRNDLQLAKLQIKFAGWFGTPKFRYYLWAWTSNANMGQGAQVVLGGTLSYLLNSRFSLGAGIAALPTTRSTRGTFPYWLRVDARPMADEFFRGSYTTGIFAFGDIIDKNLHYKAMWGNNLSQLGIDAGQLDNAFQTIATALWWTTDNYGAYEGVGDFYHHEKPALTFGADYTYSREDKQSQPGKDDFENTQLRLSDGTAIFDPDAFGPGLQVNEATYQMAAFDGGVKYRGFSFDYNYYLRWINSLSSSQALPFRSFFDHGFDLQASYMLVPKIWQIYTFGSKVFGQFGDPWEIGGGFNVFPFKNKAARFNVELDYYHRSPVGYLAYPSQVGMKGPVFMTNFELNL